jgi:S1-C subfamily serine protease
MLNKVMLGLLVLLLLITGGVGYYSYRLNQQVDELSRKVTNSEATQSTNIKAFDEELSALEQKITNGIDGLQGGIDETKGQLDSQKSEIESAQSEIAAVQAFLSDSKAQIDSLESQVGELDRSVSDLAEKQDTISKSIFDVSKVYDSVKQATVRISDGQRTIGSGFIYDTAGHVLTAAHVISEMTTIFVIAYDGSISEATVTGSNDISDVAVLKMTRQITVTSVKMGDSSLLKIGEPLVAIGSPLDFPDTLTSGILSSINRSTDYGWVSPVTNLLQFDAAVNSGNSGGPLLDANGEVIGLVVARITEGSGIYWAVSSNKVKRVADEIIANSSFAYPWLGVSISDLTPQMALDNSLDSIDGALVSAVSSGGPAESAGITVGDVITAIDDVSVKNTDELTSYLGEYKSPGDNAKIDLIRNGTKRSVNTVVGKR